MYREVYINVADTIDDITIYGRTNLDTDGNLHLPWSASGIALEFSGDAIGIEFLPYRDSLIPTCDPDKAYACVRIEVDGVNSSSMISGQYCVAFAGGLENGTHTLRLYKENETDEPLRIKGFRISGKSPALLPHREHFGKRVEFIGDSITCGFGVFGCSDSFIPYQESATNAYAYLTAKHFNAEARIISWSGRGIVKNYNGDTDSIFIDFFRRRERLESEGLHDFSVWQPDLLVINGGTNDASSGAVSNEEFGKGVRKLYSFVRSVYPDTAIMFAFGAMGTAYDPVYRAVVAELRESDSRVWYKPLREVADGPSERGSLDHPSVYGQRRIADELIAEIEKLNLL